MQHTVETPQAPAETNTTYLEPPGTIEVHLPEGAEAVSSTLLGSEREYRVAIAQIRTVPGRIRENTDKIIEYIQEARKRGARLVVFPELAVPGYGSMDLLFNPSYIQENILALQRIREATAGITAIVGFVDLDPRTMRSGNRPTLYNSAAIISDGIVVGVTDKSLLPNYDIFFEDRYFAPPRNRSVIEVDGLTVGTEICEDLWKDGYQIDVTQELVGQGADLIVNLSASPFNLGKYQQRSTLLQQAASTHARPIVYANLVGCFDGYEGEVVFDGRSMVMGPNGTVSALGDAFKEDLVVVDIFHPQELHIPEISEVQELHDALVLGIKDYFERAADIRGTTLRHAFIGLSGGIDSAVVAALAVEALGKERVIGITLPSRYSSDETKSDAQLLAQNLGITFKSVPIESPFEATLQSFRNDPEIAALPENVAEENIQARLRMVALMFYANKLHGIVLNTGNKTELALDNCTLYGDMVGGFSVLGDVDKDRVYSLAEYINQKHTRELIPRSTITRAPSAELKPNQTDDMVMGALPQVIAPMMRSIIEEGLSLEQAIARFGGSPLRGPRGGNTFSSDLIRRSFQRLDRSEYKRRQAAPAIRVTSHAFGNGRRMPMNHGFEGHQGE